MENKQSPSWGYIMEDTHNKITYVINTIVFWKPNQEKYRFSQYLNN